MSSAASRLSPWSCTDLHYLLPPLRSPSRHLTIRAKSHLTPLQAGRYLPIVSSVLPHLTNLTALSIPFALLSEAVFTFVYDHPTIVSLGLNNVSKGNAAHAMSLNSTVVRPPRSKPLSVPAVFLDNTRGHAFSELFSSFSTVTRLRFHMSSSSPTTRCRRS